MKKHLTLIVLAATLLATLSCQDDIVTDPQEEPAQEPARELVFTASLEGSGDTRTTLSYNGEGQGYKVSWEAGDEISVNGVRYTATPDADNAAIATFTKAGDETKADPEAPYTVYYPASIYDGTTATLPATQTYTADGSVAGILPMYAQSSTTDLSFKNLCGLFKFTLKGEDTVQRITVTDDTKALSGPFTVNADNAAVLDASASGGVTLDCGSGVALDATGKTFYVALPAGSYEGLHIEYSTARSVRNAKMKAHGTATIARNKVYAFEQTLTYDYFYFEAVTAGATVTLASEFGGSTADFQYSTDGGLQWADADNQTVTLESAGSKVFFRPTKSFTTLVDYGKGAVFSFQSTGQVNVGGNIMYMLDATDPEGVTMSKDAFAGLFAGNSSIVSAADLKLPATTLADNCYYQMFAGCTSLTAAPALPATTLAAGCYNAMFSGCTSLTAAPALPATTLAAECYNAMFEGCTSLAAAPVLPATTLAEGCYYNMFSGCESLTAAPELPATTLAAECYYAMFYSCKSLAAAPVLSATTLAESCYYYMFYGCTSLTAAPALPATTLAAKCYCEMFCECTSLTAAPALPATTMADQCYASMFSNCESLATAPALPATTLASNCYCGMFSGCKSLTTAPALPATTMAEWCYYSMFTSCTSLTAAPALPATALASNCYCGMFVACTSLAAAPALPATTLAEGCYYVMFNACTSLTAAPALPATTLDDYCYASMFEGCTSLVTAPELPATTLTAQCYEDMFNGCTSLTTAPELPATTLTWQCYRDMFNGCSKLNYVKCLATDISASYCVTSWLNDVAATGTFVKASTMTSWPTSSNSGIPSGWTVVDAE